jgi:hypothetical protein
MSVSVYNIAPTLQVLTPPLNKHACTHPCAQALTLLAPKLPQAFKATTQPGATPGSLGQPTSPQTGLLYGMPSSTAPPSRRDVEANPPRESVADRIEFTQRKKLLSLFYYGVCSYLIASMREFAFKLPLHGWNIFLDNYCTLGYHTSSPLAFRCCF